MRKKKVNESKKREKKERESRNAFETAVVKQNKL